MEPQTMGYRWCMVPKCGNTSISSPGKIFFSVPRNDYFRTKWCEAMKRDEFRSNKLSPNSVLFCCEDHFDLEKDTENFMRYKIMFKQQGVPVFLRLRKGIVPHEFHCQEEKNPTPEQENALSRPKLRMIQESSTTQEISNLCEAGPSSFSHSISPSNRKHLLPYKLVCGKENIASEEIHAARKKPRMSLEQQVITDEITELYVGSAAGQSSSPHDVSPSDDENVCDRGVQVDIKKKTKFRSKAVNVSVKTKEIALSPFKKQLIYAATSPFKSALVSTSIYTTESSPSSQTTSISSENEPERVPSEASWCTEVQEDEFKNVMRTATLLSIEKEPKMMLGLPKESYYLIDLLSESIPVPTINILITLKKIKLNESFDILAIQFGYAVSTISRIFSKTTETMSEKMKVLIEWRESSLIFENLPISFRARYSKVVSIIDCSEIEIEKPSNAVHQSLTWSQYKKCNTLKYLISCTPDGLVNFISEGYGGRASDILIVENCGYLNNLPPNKAVMADRGFKDLTHLLQQKKCTLISPPSVSRFATSTKDEVKESKRIAALRIHVERLIGRLREFHILLPHACVHHNLVPVIDKVIVVACGIINMQHALIKH